ncbi:GMC family oxidoreductase [Marinobacter daepoensis]|uniref:GMC family oxidoreductase n=1 Tax=Marinobacter daepoensis TaxID=262077 RepID=A0ABS3BFG9_9GAMM|nr:GMC family oxidoreductase [Marinobacter daepoensis]MBN7770263.1 GMC family oxidoreductase [Marinobacter daepoensis]MBY6079709.1 GMC family oxidoreductase [Marinobacter daepoensis]
MSMNDPIARGLAAGWNITDASKLTEDRTVEADVVVVGTGAGGGTTAEILARQGLSVILLEEGRLYYQKDFQMDELTSYANLYQEGMSRATADGAIAILQGRCVGGSTTVNWTSSFRTPAETLNYWSQNLGLSELTPDAMAPWFEGREQRHNMSPWQTPPNLNNDLLRQGCEKLGYSWQVIPRNVKGCWNSGYCGVGCPTNAKQGALLTTIPGALDHNAQLFHGLRADRMVRNQDRIDHLLASAMGADGVTPSGITVTLKAKHFVVAASAIGTPGLLLRSQLPDPFQRVGKRSFIHPVNATVARMPAKTDPFYGAPQSIYSDEFNFKEGTDGPVGYKLEVPPLHPAMAAGVVAGHGQQQRDNLGQLPWMQSVIALLRDGFHPDSPGGTVSLRDDGSPMLDYPITDYLWQGLKKAYLTMAEIQFAAGAEAVQAVHLDSGWYTRWSEAKTAISNLPMKPHRVRLFTAHQMGGCSMGHDPATSVVNGFGEHHHISNLNVHDASVFPTSIGANPQLSVYALAARNSTRLAQKLAPSG